MLTARALALGSVYGGLPREAIFAVILVFGAARAFEMPTIAGAAARHRARGDVPARARRVRGGEPGGDDRRPRARRPALRGEPGARVRRVRRPLSARRDCASARIRGGTRAARARAGHAGIAVCRHPLHPRASGDARRDLARSLRGAAGRRDGAAADLRQGHPARRSDRARHAARGAGDRRAGDVAVSRAAPAAAARRPDDVRRRRRIRRRDDRLRAVVVVRALARGAGPARRRPTW